MYAPTPILSTRLEIVLRQNGLPFHSQNQTFAVTERCDREQLLRTLLEQLSEPEANDLRVMFDLTNLMAATSLPQALHRANTQWFEDALVRDRFTHWFQPIVDVANGRIAGHECLIRLEKQDEPGKFYNGQDIMDAAVTRGDLHIFDSYSRRTAIRNAAVQHRTGKVFINFTPSSIYDPAFCMGSTLQAMENTTFVPDDIVFEVVESERVRDSRHLRKIADYYRERGFSMALDDVGTGANSLQTWADIQPDYVKLDKSLVWNYKSDIGRKTICKLAELAADTGIAVIAEGVETAEMRDVLRECGVSLMQGYFFGRPQAKMLESL
ncbi:hypothetical protein F183_A00310 [Bryobacterales bacterium F-183]|nr:hypothetical protein F183_A00310 [Bryobacterales bacterium F-183]